MRGIQRGKLTDEQVRQIRENVADGDQYKQVAARHRISVTQVSRIVNREQYGYVE